MCVEVSNFESLKEKKQLDIRDKYNKLIHLKIIQT